MTVQKLTQPLQLVLEVTDLQVRVFESFPPKIEVTAFATVPSTGWTRPQLIPYSYVQPPVDGIYDFAFIAARPTEPTAQIISPIRVRPVLFDADIKGIRVHASNNAKEVLLAPLLA